MEETTLKDEIKKLSENIEELAKKKEIKKFWFPFRARVGKAKARQNYASICYINENREAKFMRAPIQEGTIMLDGTPHVATTDFMLTYKNRPFLIVPAWSTSPFSPQNNYEEAVKNKTTTAGYRLLLNTLKTEQIKPKGKISMTMVLVGLVVIGVAFYFFSRGGAT